MPSIILRHVKSIILQTALLDNLRLESPSPSYHGPTIEEVLSENSKLREELARLKSLHDDCPRYCHVRLNQRERKPISTYQPSPSSSQSSAPTSSQGVDPHSVSVIVLIAK